MLFETKKFFLKKFLFGKNTFGTFVGTLGTFVWKKILKKVGKNNFCLKKKKNFTPGG